jgi:hypothetical protein
LSKSELQLKRYKSFKFQGLESKHNSKLRARMEFIKTIGAKM